MKQRNDRMCEVSHRAVRRLVEAKQIYKQCVEHPRFLGSAFILVFRIRRLSRLVRLRGRGVKWVSPNF
jgi:hypothetical protein